MTIASKLPDVGITIFTVMTNLANQHGAYNLSQGFPDFDVPETLLSLVAKHMRAGLNQYAPMQGVPILREKIVQKVQKLYGASYSPESEITITAGGTEALYVAITAVVNPGDEVIIFEPAYDSYVPAVTLNGGVPVYIQLSPPDYGIDWNRVESALSDKTRLIILNTPHNPTGSILTSEDIEALRQLVAQRPVMILSDEVYEHIIFDGQVHHSMARYADLAAKSFVVGSFGKTYHATGWKIGYCLAPAPLSKEFQKVHQFVTFAVNTPVQHAYAEFLDEESHYLSLADFYQQKRDKFLSCLAASRFKPVPCRGTYFQLLDYSAISQRGDMAFAEELTKTHKVAAIPPSVFYHRRDDHRYLRFCFAKEDETLTQAGEILCKI